MAIAKISQTLFTQGELGYYMDGRADNEIYGAGAAVVENWFLLPHGGLVRTPGFEKVDTVASATVRLGKFKFASTQEYALVFTDLQVKIYRDKVLKATIVTPYTAAQLKELRWAQSGDYLIIVHPNHAPRELYRNGSDTAWVLQSITFINTPFHRYNANQSCTPSATTGAITLTLSGSTSYWAAGHVGATIKINDGYARIDSITSGLVAQATVITLYTKTALANTTASNAWKETAWTVAHGYPRTCKFHQNRLMFGGTGDAPATIFSSKTGDFYNFDDSDTKNDNGFSFTLSTDESHFIRDLKVAKDLIIFTSEGEAQMTGGTAPISPTNVDIKFQSNYGIGLVPVHEVDGDIIFATRNNKEIRATTFDLAKDKYVSKNYTTIAQHLFDDTKSPVGMAYLRSYKQTQANLVFVVRSDGTMAVMTVNVDKAVLGWSRRTTQGEFKDCVVVATDHGDGYTVDTLYVVVERDNGVFLEALTEEDVYVDHWHRGYNASGQTTWSGLTSLANQTVQIVCDGVVHTPLTVTGGGAITLDRSADEIYVGLGYTSTLKTMPLTFSINSKIKRGERIRKCRCFINLFATRQLKVDGYEIYFRSFGGNILDRALPAFTGTEQIRLSGISADPSIIITVDQPVSATVLTLATELRVKA